MKKINKDKLIDLYGLIWTSIFIFVYMIKPETYDYIGFLDGIDQIFLLTGGTCLLLYKFVKKQKMLTSKFDLLLMLFVFTMFIPIITNTYISLTSVVKYIFIYTNFIIFYFVVKCTVSRNNVIQKFLNIFLIAISITTIYGIDTESTRFVNDALNIINYKEISDYSICKFNYTYHNVLAIVMLVGICAAQYKLNIVTGKTRTLIVLSMFLSSIGFYLAFSRIAILIFVIYEIFILIYSIKNKMNINNLLCFYTSFALAFIFSEMFQLGIYDSNIKVWLFFLLFAFLNCIFCKIIEIIKFKRIKLNVKINTKAIAPICIFLFIILFVFLVIALKTSKPIVINKDNIDTVGSRFYTLKNLDSNRLYYLIFKCTLGDTIIDYAPNEEVGYDICFFGVLENGNYELIDSLQVLKSFQDTKYMLKFDEKYTDIKVKFVPVSDKVETLTVELLQIDGVEYILDYKYIPYSISYFFKSFNYDNTSVRERIELYKDAIDICIDNNFMGLGSDAWAHIFEEYKEYNYYTTQVHSRIFEVLINYGIIGFTVYILMCVYYLVGVSKRIKTNKNIIFLICAPIVIFLQSSIDWVMSQNVVLMIMFLFLGMTNSYTEKGNGKLYKYFERITIIYFGLILTCIVYFGIVAGYVNINNKNLDNLVDEKFISDYIIFRDDDRQIKISKLQSIVADNPQLVKKLHNSLYHKLKYERNIEYASTLRQYLQLSKDYNYKIDEVLVERILKDLEPENKYCVNEVYVFLYNLYYTKNIINMDMPDCVEIINNKIQFYYNELLNNIERYNELAMDFTAFELINDENIKLVMKTIDDCKRFCYN